MINSNIKFKSDRVIRNRGWQEFILAALTFIAPGQRRTRIRMAIRAYSKPLGSFLLQTIDQTRHLYFGGITMFHFDRSRSENFEFSANVWNFRLR